MRSASFIKLIKLVRLFPEVYSLVSSASEMNFTSDGLLTNSIIKKRSRFGPTILPCVTQLFTGNNEEIILL